MSINSAQLSMKYTTIEKRQLMRAIGVKRVFDRDVSSCAGEHYWASNEDKAHPIRRASANLQVTGSLMDQVNGALYMVDRKELIRISSREDGYELIPVLVREWNAVSRNAGRLYLVYTFSASEAKYLHQSILPRPLYYAKCRQGAESVDSKFYQEWLNTSFLSDGKTPIGDWDQEFVSELS